ncbi:hypothetical protein L6164_008685 [Bauhinia variegata]|uniref:Uncharacterized protein n=1 Tax=Bauhinia variegata TaxID=167791 RepID=A0ACB9PH85_BAUVA|nr:hypothetical protein L6164_008685 [Bauhinia variegata]
MSKMLNLFFNYCKRKQVENPNFFYAIQCDEDYRRRVNIFWVDARSRLAYQQFGHVISISCLEAMDGKKPLSIVTLQDLAIEAVLAKVFLETSHSRCLWHIRKKFPEELAHIYHKDLFLSFFDSIGDAKTSLQEFVMKFEKATDSFLEVERREDYEFLLKSCILSTGSKLEEHAALVYIRNIFDKFQDELGKINQFTKQKIRRDGPRYVYHEFMGILCKHILLIFQAKGIVQIPNHLILHHWTKDANKDIEVNYTKNNFTSQSTPRILERMHAQQLSSILESINSALDGLKQRKKVEIK